MTTVRKFLPEALMPALRRLRNAFSGSRRHSGSTTKDNWEHDLKSLDPGFRSALLSMYLGNPQVGSDGDKHALVDKTRINSQKGNWLYHFCLSQKPSRSVEIGMAYGFSTLFIMAAMTRNRTGHHTSIDPLQHSDWSGIGFTHAMNAAGTDVGFRFIEDRSDCAAIDLAREKQEYDLIFIDGNHKFDDVLVDFYLFAPLCAIGGHVVFDDANLNSIHSVIAFVRSNRSDFEEVSGAPRGYCVFRRVGDDQRHWRHFRRFSVAEDND